jgi:hypothetical protein
VPKLLCECNSIIDYGIIPAKDEWLLISDVEFDQFSGLIDTELLYRNFKPMLKCPVCGRLHIFWDGFQHSPQIYTPEK